VAYGFASGNVMMFEPNIVGLMASVFCAVAAYGLAEKGVSGVKTGLWRPRVRQIGRRWAGCMRTCVRSFNVEWTCGEGAATPVSLYNV
jgi:hypothetical protein